MSFRRRSNRKNDYSIYRLLCQYSKTINPQNTAATSKRNKTNNSFHSQLLMYSIGSFVIVIIILLVWHSKISMGTILSSSSSSNHHSSSSLLRNHYSNQSTMKFLYEPKTMQYRIESALWSYFVGDALASPTHWFYGGLTQIQQYYGPDGIRGYTKPVFRLMGSILNKSNLSGGGRSTSISSSSSRRIVGNDGKIIELPPTIIGHVINHGKQDYWDPNKNIHYHATLHAGENTLEVQLGRVLMKSIVANKGQFKADHFRNAYIQFMTTPGSHNDTYASTCHRMFFANYIYKQLPAEQCPDNDSHNVDTIDGLVLPTITALAVSAQPDSTIDDVRRQCAETVAVTRRSKQLEQYAAAWGELIYTIIRSTTPEKSAHDDVGASSSSSNIAQMTSYQMAQTLHLRHPEVRKDEEMTACYLNSAVPAMLDSIVTYTDKTKNDIDNNMIWQALLMNANTGGENVHRGSCLGAVLGAYYATTTKRNDDETTPIIHSSAMTGLYDYASLQNEIHDFIQTTTTTNSKAT